MQSLGIQNQTDELYKIAKKGLIKLNIAIIQGPIKTLWFRTMLVQGGLSTNAIRTATDGLSTFKEFLRKLISHCSYYEFLESQSNKLLQIKATKINDQGNLPHLREMILESNNFTFIIRPNGGILNGWKLDNRNLPTNGVADNFDSNIKLFNQAKNDGILYNVVFEKKIF